jgi:hypothetical protein
MTVSSIISSSVYSIYVDSNFNAINQANLLLSTSNNSNLPVLDELISNVRKEIKDLINKFNFELLNGIAKTENVIGNVRLVKNGVKELEEGVDR